MKPTPNNCPFCGGQAYATRTVNGTQMFYVGCSSCGIKMKAAWYRDEDRPTKDILAFWNRRAEARPSTDKIEQEASRVGGERLSERQDLPRKPQHAESQHEIATQEKETSR